MQMCLRLHSCRDVFVAHLLCRQTSYMCLLLLFYVYWRLWQAACALQPEEPALEKEAETNGKIRNSDRQHRLLTATAELNGQGSIFGRVCVLRQASSSLRCYLGWTKDCFV